MFKELAPYLRQRAVLLTVTYLEEDQIRVNVIPKKLKDGENAALTTPLSVTGTAEELDRDLPSTLVNFVSSHLRLRNSLEKAQTEMDAAAKMAQAEARAKAKTPTRKDPPKPEDVKPAVAAKPVEIAKPEPPRTASLFDAPSPATAFPSPVIETDEEDDILAEIEDEDQTEDGEELDAAA
jgi:PRTRC genetic system protein E